MIIRMRDIDTVKPELRGKKVGLLFLNEDGRRVFRVELQEDAGRHSEGDRLSGFTPAQTEQYSEEHNMCRFYDRELAAQIDAEQNQPYPATGEPCHLFDCDNDNGFAYQLTGYIYKSDAGMTVEKKCAKCHTPKAIGPNA